MFSYVVSLTDVCDYGNGFQQDGDYLDMELSGQTNGDSYVAAGFSTDDRMVGDIIDVYDYRELISG